MSSPFYLYTDNLVASMANSKFYDSVNLNEEFINLNNEIFGLLSWLQLDSLFISVTDIDSVFYRFKVTGHSFEFMWEAFLDYDGQGNKGSTLQIYRGDEKIKSTFGNTEDIYGVVNEIAFSNEDDLNEEFTLISYY